MQNRKCSTFISLRFHTQTVSFHGGKSKKEIIQIRWTNLIGLNLYLISNFIAYLTREKITFLHEIFGFTGIISGFFFVHFIMVLLYFSNN